MYMSACVCVCVCVCVCGVYACIIYILGANLYKNAEQRFKVFRLSKTILRVISSNCLTARV